MDHAFDTNIIVHLLIGTASVRLNRDKARTTGLKFIIPPFAHYEMQRGLLIRPNDKNKRAYAELLENCILGEMTTEIWEKAAEIYANLYAKRFTVRDSDIVIAAFCIENDCTLVTNNTKDFINIDGLRLVDWVT